MRATRLSLAALLLAACMPNPYARFYQGAPDARTVPGYRAPEGPVQIYSTNNFDRDVRELMRRGYLVVGQSAFNAGMASVKASHLRAQANRVGAQVVLVASQYTNTVSGVIPLTVPTTSTTTTTATATASGPGGTATATGYGTSTTYGTRTVAMPYAVARGDFAAVYLVRTRPRLGIYVEPLDDATRLQLQTNVGLRVTVVVEGTPAFDADVLPGDILLEIGGQRVGTLQRFGELVGAAGEDPVEFVLRRNGQEVRKSVKLLPATGG